MAALVYTVLNRSFTDFFYAEWYYLQLSNMLFSRIKIRELSVYIYIYLIMMHIYSNQGSLDSY